jgi:hypothetical protein
MKTGQVAKLFHRIKTWLLWLAIATPLVLHYAPVPPEWESKALPLAVACALGVAVEMLASIEEKLRHHLPYKEYPSFTDAIPDILELLSAKKSGHVIKILSSSGGTTINTLISRIAGIVPIENRGRIELRLNIVSPESPLVSAMPSHWKDEVRLSLSRLKQQSAGMQIHCFEYDHLPCLRGVLIDDYHLFFGFFRWDDQGSLAGAEQPHFYVKRTEQTHYFVDIWESWFDHGRTREVWNSQTVEHPN